MAALLAYVGVKSKTAMLLLLNQTTAFMCSANIFPQTNGNQNGD
jgi:hypothetical protein